ncbi:hypothetical protein GMOD_00001245 [Pyrenophora seminiperda CCB06]|uniref:Uncharacterized protein n=1 Tax=Pyrenophora seminiperda CCB06 TaxID=1302712 RepID=A0A3M7LYS8_9PLEO|nr:hypothetical protein GMOD_00001245 [Pyrenophora seminiperda CCB06]
MPGTIYEMITTSVPCQFSGQSEMEGAVRMEQHRKSRSLHSVQVSRDTCIWSQSLMRNVGEKARRSQAMLCSIAVVTIGGRNYPKEEEGVGDLVVLFGTRSHGRCESSHAEIVSLGSRTL